MINKRLKITFAVVAFILLIPLVAMQFTNEVNWGIFDFVIMGILLLGTGLMIELVTRKVKTQYRIVLYTVIFLSFLLVWAELAVGIFGTPFAGS